jgi:hypothetical protein
MAGCLLAMITYIPIYHAMHAAAGSNIVTVASQKNPATGETLLTPLAANPGGDMTPAPKVLVHSGFSGFISNPAIWMLVGLVFIQVLWVTMVYGPIAAYLVEAFPAKIRYTALSLPYHIGNGVFGGLLPVIGVLVVAQTGNIYAGLSDNHRGDHAGCGVDIFEGDARAQDLGRGGEVNGENQNRIDRMNRIKLYHL